MPDDDDLPKDLSHLTPAYRKALWIVVLINMGYGIIEMIGGFISDSQALKADALDFLGDGSITFLGLLAIGWGLRLRARSALIQGIFLGAMGISILSYTIYRTQVLQTPEAGLMGIFGFVALVINVIAVIILLPHRKGDANVRAVWLFSRNDALGNILVIIASGFVFLTDTSWPDLIVAGVIAVIFLQSSWSIIKDARSDIKNLENR
ncbi:cation efflux family protein [Candidatus Nitrosopumilus salaria BD31]|uniref:Cation efflux family protein n=1 Tax=Candidatus Nitrosopumilus salarius BD31 TaxID=859350 RepID=I3D406_9ARCH|nr:cation transporter [Candidatus Nitrosopumilus salaria]EIJ66449.1 cation efflux family protein [Candidatus Nitrosopumilus salaria BD31]